MLNDANLQVRPPLALGVVGHTGRFGSQVIAAADRRGWNVCWRRDSAGIRSSAMPAVLFDGSVTDAARQSVDMAVAWGIPLVLATSGVPWRDVAWVRDAATQIPLVVATNLSRGHRLQLAIARLIADLGGAGLDVRVVDRHPATKADPISATAHRLAAAACTTRIASVRAGPPVADHRLIVKWPGETLEINHLVTSLDAPAEGALCAIEAASRLDKPGLYDLDSPELALHTPRSPA